jgi:hypothetical protein
VHYGAVVTILKFVRQLLGEGALHSLVASRSFSRADERKLIAIAAIEGSSLLSRVV